MGSALGGGGPGGGRKRGRTVENGRPARTETAGQPVPRAPATRARPMTATAPALRHKRTSGSSTWVFALMLAAATSGTLLLGTSFGPHVTAAGEGPWCQHATTRRAAQRPSARSASTLAGSFSTISTRCLRHHPEGPLVLRQEEARGPLRVQGRPNAVAAGNDTASTEPPTPGLPLRVAESARHPQRVCRSTVGSSLSPDTKGPGCSLAWIP